MAPSGGRQEVRPRRDSRPGGDPRQAVGARAPARFCAATGSPRCCSARSCPGRRKNVPVLPEDEASTRGLTRSPACRKAHERRQVRTCHARIDPIGFCARSVRRDRPPRAKDLGDRPVETTPGCATARRSPGSMACAIPLKKRREAVCPAVLPQASGLCARPRSAALRRAAARRDGAEAPKGDFRFRAVVETIVISRQFREIRGRDASRLMKRVSR